MRTVRQMIMILTLAVTAFVGMTACEKLNGAMAMDDVSLVKSGRLEMDPSVTVGQAIDNYQYFKAVRWESNIQKNGRKVVSAIGEYDMEMLPAGFSPNGVNITGMLVESFQAMGGAKVDGLMAIYDFHLNQDGSFMVGGCTIIPHFVTSSKATVSLINQLSGRNPPQQCVKNLSQIYNNILP